MHRINLMWTFESLYTDDSDSTDIDIGADHKDGLDYDKDDKVVKIDDLDHSYDETIKPGRHGDREKIEAPGRIMSEPGLLAGEFCQRSHLH